MVTRFWITVLMLAGLSIAANPVSFKDVSRGYPVGGSGALIVGDLNGDGTPDVATSNGSNSISVLLGDANRTFLPAQSYATSAGINNGLAIGDFNGDGHPDLVTANYNTAEVSVLLGTGDGTFGAAHNFPVGGQPTSVIVGDFNGDGKQDLVTGSFFTTHLSILFGNGDGTFQAAKSFGFAYPLNMVTGDFNGDGKADLAIVDNYSATVLLGNGDGTFRSGWRYSFGGFVQAVALAAGDLNLDGKLDLVVGGNTGFLKVFLGKGDGSFTLAASLTSLDDCCAAVVITDINEDGKPDVLANGGKLYVALGTGDGSLQTPKVLVACGTGVFAAGKFGHDQHPDLAVGCGNTVGILQGRGDGTFIQPPQIPEQEPTALAFADFNADGKLDMAVVSNPAGLVGIFLGNGDGTFKKATAFLSAQTPRGSIRKPSSPAISITTGSRMWRW